MSHSPSLREKKQTKTKLAIRWEAKQPLLIMSNPALKGRKTNTQPWQSQPAAPDAKGGLVSGQTSTLTRSSNDKNQHKAARTRRKSNG